MGCDIHVHIELKRDGQWMHYAAPAVRRNYVLFAMMAECGRCEDIKPIHGNRGVPDDATVITSDDFEHWDTVAHSASWLGRSEIDELRERYANFRKDRGESKPLDDDLECGILRTYLWGNNITSLDDTPYDDVRLVFWFDN